MTFDIYEDGMHLKVSTVVGDGLTKFVFKEIEPEQEVLTTKEAAS